MTKNNIKRTKVWQINKTLVVADTVEQAIQLYKTWSDIDIENIYAVKPAGVCLADNTALWYNETIVVEVNDSVSVSHHDDEGQISITRLQKEGGEE